MKRPDDTHLLDPPETGEETPIPALPAFTIGDRPKYPHVTASEMLRVALCPGSYQMRLKHPEKKWHRAHKDYSEEGTDGHEALRTEDFTGLPDEQVEFLHLVIKQRDELIRTLLGEDARFGVLKERRYYIRDGLKPLTSGQLDYFVIADGGVAVIVDYKLLWGDHASAQYNLQLRTQAVLLHHSDPSLKEIFVAIVQPRRGQPSVAKYNERSLKMAEEEILGYIHGANGENPRLIPGTRQCKYCPAKLHCPAANQNLSHVSALALTAEEGEDSIPNETLLELYDRAGAAIEMAEKIRALTKLRLKAYTETGETNALTDYLALKEVKGRREVKDPEKAYQILFELCDQDKDKTAALFAKSVEIRIRELEKQYRLANQVGAYKSSGRPKYITHKEASTRIAEAFGDLIQTGTREPEVVRVEKMIESPKQEQTPESKPEPETLL